MTEKAQMKEIHLREAEYCPRMVAQDDTNLKLLMAEYERLSKLDHDDHIVQSPVNYSFKPCSSEDIDGHTRVTLKDLTKVPHEIHQQRFFVCRTKTAFIRSHSLLIVVETPDPSGEYQGTLLSIRNNIRPVDEKSQSCDSVLNSGTIVVVKNPFYTKSSYDSFYTVKCDNPDDVVVLKPELFCLFPNLKWPSREPQSEEKFSLIKQWWRWLWSSPSKDWKKVAELRLEKQNYQGALEAYELALGYNPRDIEVLTLRSALYLKFKVYQKLLKDSESILEIETGNKRAIYCRALSFIGLGRYKLALQFLETHIEKCRLSRDADHETELLKIQSRAKTWRKQGECGEYDIVKMFECPNTYSHDCANYLGNVRRQDIVGKGKGIVATADIQCGELLMAEKAFSIVHSKDVKFKTAVVHTSVENEFQRNAHVKLVASIVYRLVFNSDLGKELYSLFDGTQCSISKQTEAVEENDFIDIKRINSICNYNSFSSIMDTSKPGDENCLQGLWIFGAYFNHNCQDANSNQLISGDFMFIRASRNIKKHEEICISYIDRYMPYPERLFALSKYNFMCQCTLCQLDSKDSEAVHIRRRELLANISSVKPDSASRCSTVEKLIMKLTCLRQEDRNRSVYTHKPLMQLAGYYEEAGDYKRASNIYHSVQNLCSGTSMIETSLMSGYHALVCYMSSGQTKEATRCAGALKAVLIQKYGTDTKDIMKFVSKDLAMLIEHCERNH